MHTIYVQVWTKIMQVVAAAFLILDNVWHQQLNKNIETWITKPTIVNSDLMLLNYYYNDNQNCY